MTVAETLTYFQQSAEKDLAALLNALAKQDANQAAFNLRSAFNATLMSGMIKWRHQQGSPRREIEAAVQIAHRARKEIVALPPYPLWKFFDFGSAALVSAVCNGALDRDLRYATCDFREWPKEAWKKAGSLLERSLDAGILSAIENKSVPDNWHTLLEQVAAKKRLTLLHDSFAAYMRVVAAWLRGDANETAEAVRQGDRNYRKRAKNAYYSGGLQILGGGSDNELVVDYRLAALIRMCLPDQGALLTGDAAIHVWRWG